VDKRHQITSNDAAAPHPTAGSIRTRYSQRFNSVPAEHECLEWKVDGLEPQNQGMHECQGIYGVKNQTSNSASIF
jgi:hypothetical protein